MKYVARKTTSDGRYLYLFCFDWSRGYSAEAACGGPQWFTNKAELKSLARWVTIHEYRYQDTIKDEVLTYSEYLDERDLKLDKMELLLHESGFETHRIYEEYNRRLYVYLSDIKYGLPVAQWIDISLSELAEVEQLVLKSKEGCLDG